MLRIETQIRSSRDTFIPVTIVEGCNKRNGLLLCAHGFKANRKEDGRFLTVAEELAKDGISSIMMGFPGCDKSKEDFINYTLKNCLDDIDTCYTYMKENYEIDLSRIGMIGYSMGGRLTALYIENHPEIRCIGLWAAASYEGFDGENEFLGEDVRIMKKQAEELGYCDFYNAFDDTHIRLSKQLLEDMEYRNPLIGLNSYQGSAIIVHGTKDNTVVFERAKESYRNLLSAGNKKLVAIENADHGFGAWDQHPELSRQLTDETIRYFRSQLK